MNKLGTYLVAGALLAGGCSQDELLAGPVSEPAVASSRRPTPTPTPPSLVGTSRTLATPIPDASASSSPSAAPSSPGPSPSAPPTSQVSAGATPAPVPTLPGLATPRPYQTPLAERVLDFGLSAAPRQVVLPPGLDWPWLLQGNRLVACGSAGPASTLATVSAGVLAVVPDGSSGAWLISEVAEHLNLFGGAHLDRRVALGAGVSGVVADASEAWAIARDGLVVLDRSTAATRSVSVEGVRAIALGASSAWVATEGKELVALRRRDGVVQRRVTLAGVARTLAVDAAGTVWAGSASGPTLWYLPAGDQVPEELPLAAAPTAILAVGNRVWVASGSRVGAFGADGTSLGSSIQPLSATQLAVDARGRIWLGDPQSARLIALWGG